MPSFVITGAVEFDRLVDSSSLPAHLSACLKDMDANAVRVSGKRITFEGGIFRLVTNWNVLVPFGFGDLVVDDQRREIRYCLTYKQLAISGMVGCGIAEIGLAILRPQQMFWAMPSLPVLCVALSSINLAIGVSRFQGFLRHAIADASRT
jgi:hypothetical protein